MSSTDYFSSFNLSSKFMDSKFGYFKAGDDLKQDDAGSIVLTEQQFIPNSQPWNPTPSSGTDVNTLSPGNVAIGGYHSFEDIVSKILDEETPEIKIDCADKFGKSSLDEAPNEINNHGVFSPLSNNLFNPNACLNDNDLSQTIFSPGVVNQANDYKNFLNPPKQTYNNQVENGFFNLQSFNNSNSNLNYLNNYFIALQNAFFTNPELFKSAMNPNFQNLPSLYQYNILENLLNANAMKQSVFSNGFNQANRQPPNSHMPYQNQKNIFFAGNSPYRLNVPFYKQTSTFPQTIKYNMDNMTSTFNINQPNQQVLNNSMHFKNNIDAKTSNNLPSQSVTLYVELCLEQLNLLSKEEYKISNDADVIYENKNGINAGNIHIKLNNLITESFRIHFKVSLLLKELMRQGGSRVEKVTQEAIDAWFESMTRLQNKYKEDLFANVNRSASFQCNEGGIGVGVGNCLEEVHERLRRVRTLLWCLREVSCNHACATNNLPSF